jgi:valyl-tRNA synthetase
MDLPKKYNAEEVEKRWNQFWDKEKIYKFDPKSKKPIFSIDVPPPYASAGHLHIGHALHYTQFEIIARQRRMAGFNVYFAPCFDDNGLPTEKYVENKLGISKKDVTKEEFRKICMKEIVKVEKEYSEKVFKKLGHSYDWDLLYTTISPEAQKVAQTSFIKLVKQNDAYRSEEPTIWCSHHQTALAQAEVEDLKRKTKLNHIYFDLEDGGKIEIATTRPEFLAACVGIFVHPDDKRYKSLVGKNVIVPIYNKKVKVMTDDTVDMTFGSAIMMVCSWGDTSDIEKWKKYKLDLVLIINKDGTLNEKTGKYKGMTIKEGKEAILEDLEKEGKLIKQEDLEQTVGACWRCDTPVEYIHTKQWFIDILKHKEAVIKKGRKINWYPDFFRNRFEDWTNNLAWNWCISRQRYFGVPIPVWYCKKCGDTFLPDEKDLPLDPEQIKPNKKCKCGSNEFEPDHDVFDTWMTSSMTPEIAIKWLEEPKEFDKRFPTTLRVQSSDIIRTWSYYTILKAHVHFNKIPWEDIAIGTFVLGPDKKGMSKSKGNVVWTHEILDKYSVDSFRYWVGSARWGTDIPFKEQDLVAGQKFETKLWNASKFCMMLLKDYKVKKEKLEAFDSWMLSKLNRLIKENNDFFKSYNTGEAKRKSEHFFWHDFCDNYLEIVKDRLYNPDKRNGSDSAKYTLYTSLLNLLKLFAPIMPYITEEIYQLFYKETEKGKSLHLSSWPKYDSKLVFEKEEEIGDRLIEVIAEVRKIKSENKVSLKEEVKELVLDLKEEEVKEFLDDLKAVTKAKKVSFGKKLAIKL